MASTSDLMSRDRSEGCLGSCVIRETLWVIECMKSISPCIYRSVSIEYLALVYPASDTTMTSAGGKSINMHVILCQNMAWKNHSILGRYRATRQVFDQMLEDEQTTVNRDRSGMIEIRIQSLLGQVPHRVFVSLDGRSMATLTT